MYRFYYLLFISIILLALAFRLYNVNWDQGFHLHPDERAIVMYASNITLPTSVHEFLSKDSTLNPHFFAYGSFPLYLIKALGSIFSFLDGDFATYAKMNLLGRAVSAFADIGTLLMVFLFARKLFDRRVALFAMFFYAVAVLPIQLSHFYAVDTLLTFFVMVTLYQLLLFYEKPTFGRSLLVGICFGFALATKVSALVLVISIGFALVVDFFLLVIKAPHRFHQWVPHLPKFMLRLIKDLLIIVIATVTTFVILEPYAVIDFQTFLLQTAQQSIMTKNAFIFPYTLQYVGKPQYLYELKNVFLWGLGFIEAFFAFAGALYFTFVAIKKEKKEKWAKEIILATFFWIYFFVVGKFAIGFMRYMLPLYPLLTIFAGLIIVHLLDTVRNHMYRKVVIVMVFIGALFWPVAFLHIYTFPNTRVQATQWIRSQIPSGKTIAIEHWDDSLPLYDQQRYRVETLQLYNPDTIEKWNTIHAQLSHTDYIILASNRLYVPLQKLTDCQKLPANYCYPKTAAYYKALFDGSLGFKQVAQFSTYPTIPLFNISVDDQGADESFTVYDHPKILIFKKQ